MTLVAMDDELYEIDMNLRKVYSVMAILADHFESPDTSTWELENRSNIYVDVVGIAKEIADTQRERLKIIREQLASIRDDENKLLERGEVNV